MTRSRMNKALGLLLCLGAIGTVAAGWAVVRYDADAFTDNAYVRADVTSIAPKVAGYVTSVAIDDNQAVRTGDILFRIDDRDYRARLAQAVATVEAALARLANVDSRIQLQHALVRQAQAQRSSALAELTLAAKASDRRHELGRSHTISQAQVDEGDAARSRAEAAVAAAAAAVEAEQERISVLSTEREAAIAAIDQARAARDLARTDLDHTIVRAPVDGVVGNRQIRVGRLLTPGASVLDLVPLDNVWVVANFKETQIGRIRPGQHADITVDGYPQLTLDGVVDSFAPGSGAAFSLLPADNATGNFVRVVQRVPVKIRVVGNPIPRRLVPGLSARVEIHVESGS